MRLPVVVLEFFCRAERALTLPEYAGSALRGVFGGALRRLACMARRDTCAGCAIRATCPYALVFEVSAPAVPGGAATTASNPYVIEPPDASLAPGVPPGGEFSFRMVLWGAALAQVPLIVFAWQRGLGKGLTAARVPVELLRVEQVDGEKTAAVFDAAGDGRVEGLEFTTAAPAVTAGEAPDGRLRLEFLTPLRVLFDGHPLTPDTLTPARFFAALARRAAAVLGAEAGETTFPAPARAGELAAAVTVIRNSLYWHDWTRYSNRQQCKIALGGVQGQWTLSGVAPGLVPLLAAGALLHAGKSTVMGLGKYRIAQ